MYDLILRNATVVDGTGRERYQAAVGIQSGQIVSVADRSDHAAAKREMDVEGLVVAPGFIDLHTHSDYSIPSYPRADSMIRQGVTTQVLGNCGFSPFPMRPSRRDLTRSWAAFFGGDPSWEWETAAEYIAFLESLPLSCNVALQVGHGALRIAAMGFDDRPPTAAELTDMKSLLADALDDGVFALTTGLIYPPGSFSHVAELVELAGLLPAHGAYYASHIRGEGEALLDAVGEALRIGRETGVPVHLSHHKAQGRSHWGQVEESLGLVDAAIAAGRDVTLDQYPYAAGSTTLTAVLPAWAMEGGIPALLASLRGSGFKSRVLDEMLPSGQDVPALNWHGFDVDTIMISWLPEGPNKQYEQMLLTDVAARRNENPAEAALYLIESERARVQIITFSMSESDVQQVMRHPHGAVASDGWILNPASLGTPHPRSYGTYARVLGRYVRELGILSLEEAVRKMTSLPARRLGLPDLGRIEPGCAADLVVFDPATVADRATFQQPHQYCEGVEYVIVAGQVVIEKGCDTGAAAGRVLRRAQVLGA